MARLEQAGRVLFDALPAPTQRRVRALAGRPGPRQVPLAGLDDELAVAADLFGRSEDAARAHLSGFELVPPAGRPPDPFSEEYTAWVWDVYRAVSGRSGYTLDNEASPLDVEAALRRPYPYLTGSAAVVGEDLEARGRVLRALGAGRPAATSRSAAAHLDPPAKVVEFGAGWGNLTGDLLATGYDVVAVEVDEGFCELLSRRAPEGGRLTVHRMGMLSFEPGEPADAAVFFESFHHCADHRRMLARLQHIVRPEGVVLFAGEPVHPMPYPWGPRLDGLSLWSTRTYGWLELGFEPAYFRAALVAAGWGAECIRARTNPKAEVIVARRLAAPI